VPIKNFRAKKETFFEPKKKLNKSTLKIFPGGDPQIKTNVILRLSQKIALKWYIKLKRI